MRPSGSPCSVVCELHMAFRLIDYDLVCATSLRSVEYMDFRDVPVQGNGISIQSHRKFTYCKRPTAIYC